ncbi:TPA: patatin-like phospholipase family protein [Burkholderia cenocepacia]|uniref:patatin-like phospholipase family protein n=2 Tax=Burkholderia cenocepacia TaxID=95486 RepID=UPI001BA20CD8|nr:patatin-like phospholipase family protein [Burkholderia cenocepacia]MBR8374089.1 patatin-like phospholipase family protein [Burkholderia cenocepacia]MDI9688503.1 patatin-like phospholipase family protein [Burkholderia cenocepacia]HEP6433171.1 patatin-like phospholipase family protein [Burkholderia cenocepacia]
MMTRTLTLDKFGQPPAPWWLRVSTSPVLLTFQGGGAKGVVHVGALAAVEEVGLRVQGAAGTSAGAMMAALVAARYTSREIFNLDTGQNILDTLGGERGLKRPTQFFGRRGWFTIALIRRLIKVFSGWRGRASLCVAAGGLIVLIWEWPHWAAAVVAAAAVGSYFLVRWTLRGIASVAKVRDFVDRALAAKLGMARGDVTFRDLASYDALPLKIVATNVSGRCVEVFSVERTPDTAVADAVAASICLPFVFVPWRFKRRRGAGVGAREDDCAFVDGGVMSNLPVWTFDAERRQQPDLVTIAFSIEASREGPSKKGHWLGGMLESIVAGSLEIHLRAVERMLFVPIPTDLKLFQFDATRETLRLDALEAREAVAVRLHEGLTSTPTVLESACEELLVTVRDLFATKSGDWFPAGDVPTLKVAVAVRPAATYGDLAVPYHAGYGEERPVVEPGLLVRAWEAHEASYTLFTGGAWPGDHWLICFPVSRREEEGILPTFEGRIEKPLVIMIEADAEVDAENEEAFEAFVSQLSEFVIDFVEEFGLYDAVQRSTSTPWE